MCVCVCVCLLFKYWDISYRSEARSENSGQLSFGEYEVKQSFVVNNKVPFTICQFYDALNILISCCM